MLTELKRLRYDTYTSYFLGTRQPDDRLGAADGDQAHVFNNICNLGSMAMTGFLWSEEK